MDTSIVRADIRLHCDEDMLSKTANRFSVCVSCDHSIDPVAGVRQATQTILQIVKQCQALGVEISGEITVGDDLYFAEAAKLLRNETPDLGLKFSSIGYSIDSPGGDGSTAMKLGEVLYLSRASMNVGKCYSACVITISGAIGRFYRAESDVRVHRAFPANPEKEADFLAWTKREEEIYQQLARYFEKFGVSFTVLEKMKVTPSSESRHLTSTELESLGLGSKNVRFEEEARFTITKNCGEADYLHYRSADGGSQFQILKKCAPDLVFSK